MITSDLLAALGQPGADPSTWAALVDRHGARLWAVCQAAVGKDLAEDAFQEGLIAIRQSAGRFRPGADAESSALAWMVTVVHCRALNLQRREMRKAKREGRAMPNETPAPATSSEDDQAQVARQAMRALEQLPERHQQVIRLRLLGGLDAAQTAAALGCPAEQVRVRLHRALDVLRRRCAPLLGAALPSVPALEDAIHHAAIPPATLPVALRAKAMAAFTAPKIAAAGGSLGSTLVLSAAACGAIAAALCVAMLTRSPAHAPGTGTPASAVTSSATPAIGAGRSAELAAVDPAAADQAADAAWRATIDQQLDRRITVDFHDSAFPEVVQFLQAVSGTTMVIDPTAAAKKPLPVTLKTHDLKIRNILDIALLYRGLSAVIRDRSLVICAAGTTAAGMPGMPADEVTAPVGNQTVVPWRKAIDDQLDQHVTIDFAETGVSDEVAFLQAITKLNLVLAPGITDDNTPPVTIKADNTKLHTVFDAMMQQSGLTYELRDGAILINKSESVPASLNAHG